MDPDDLSDDDAFLLEVESLAEELYTERAYAAGCINVRWWQTASDRTQAYYRRWAYRRLLSEAI